MGLRKEKPTRALCSPPVYMRRAAEVTPVKVIVMLTELRGHPSPHKNPEVSGDGSLDARTGRTESG